jgi:hypothetical protein
MPSWKYLPTRNLFHEQFERTGRAYDEPDKRGSTTPPESSVEDRIHVSRCEITGDKIDRIERILYVEMGGLRRGTGSGEITRNRPVSTT